MAQLYQCDRCGSQTEAEGESRREWTAISLAKVTNASVPFQKMDLCEACTTFLRRFMSHTGAAA